MKNRYSVSETIKNMYSLCYTKLFFSKARLIRLPFYFRGKKKWFFYGKGFTSGYRCRIEMFDLGICQNEKKIHIGNNCRIGDNVHIASGESVYIGENCLFASNIYISDIMHGNFKGNDQSNPSTPPNSRKLTTSPVIIEDNVWIGENVAIMPGVKIGSGVIVGAHSVVTKNIETNCICVGNPARVIKKYNAELNCWERVK